MVTTGGSGQLERAHRKSLWRHRVAIVALATFVPLGFGSNTHLWTANADSQDRSGGKSVAHKGGGARVRSAQKDAPSAELRRINVAGVPLNAAEPTLGLTKDGDIFYTAFESSTRIEVAHSSDKGRTWDLRSPNIGGSNVHGLSLDPYIYVDKDTDRIFNIDLTVACSYMSFSDDNGKSWITNPLACGRPVNDHQTLFSGPPVTSPTVGYESIVYYCWNDIGSSSCTKSLDGGLSFSPTGAPAYPGVDPDAGNQGNSFCGGLHGHGFVAEDGTVLLPKGHCGQPWLAISKDEGKTWARVQVASNGMSHHEADAVMDKKGNIYYIYVARDRLPYFVVSRDGGKSWGNPIMVGAPGLKEANLPAMDLGAQGKVAFAYMGSENSPFRANQDSRGDYSEVTWNGYMAVTSNGLDKRPLFFTGTVNHKKDPLVRFSCGPGRCQAVYDFIDVVVGPDGSAWGAFVDACISACVRGGDIMGAEALVGHFVGGPRLN